MPEEVQFLSGFLRQVVIRAHREQLDEIAELGFKEETLVSQLASHVSSFDWTRAAGHSPVGGLLATCALWYVLVKLCCDTSKALCLL